MNIDFSVLHKKTPTYLDRWVLIYASDALAEGGHITAQHFG